MVVQTLKQNMSPLNTSKVDLIRFFKTKKPIRRPNTNTSLRLESVDCSRKILLLFVVAPNSVQIHPSIAGGVPEGEVISLTCAVAVSHPPATVRWFEFPPGSGGAADSGREITDLAQIDLVNVLFTQLLYMQMGC